MIATNAEPGERNEGQNEDDADQSNFGCSEPFRPVRVVGSDLGCCWGHIGQFILINA